MLPQVDADSTYHLKILDRDHPQRRALEEAVSGRYREAFGAVIPHFMDHLIGFYGTGGELLAACGYQSLATQPAYLEQYLEESADKVMSRKSGCQIQRTQIVEIGHLASFSRSVARVFFAALAKYLTEQGFHWCVSTVTGPLYALFKRQGIDPLVLCDARAEAVGQDRRLWGQYYQHRPQVCGGSLRLGARRLVSVLNSIKLEVTE
ncbi:thermostable hemolysin [Pontibacterium granulatum]|uniref:thermostable hemolysin n=1 Tax=Pontibacterium granulatum TaxID=2036029 RepID=UPI00249BFE1E|nr:thermostable hemolysin [Pontibacterium granulatum]MDI3323445.1 thermostable hemolysin [Pontibacterium granulatum]